MQFDPFSLIIIAFVAGGFLSAGYHIWQTKRCGIETEAYVTRIEERETYDSDGAAVSYEDCYVCYRDAEGRCVEATVSNPARKGLVPGAWIRIRYLPERPEAVVYVGMKKDEA